MKRSKSKTQGIAPAPSVTTPPKQTNPYFDLTFLGNLCVLAGTQANITIILQVKREITVSTIDWFLRGKEYSRPNWSGESFIFPIFTSSNNLFQNETLLVGEYRWQVRAGLPDSLPPSWTGRNCCVQYWFSVTALSMDKETILDESTNLRVTSIPKELFQSSKIHSSELALNVPPIIFKHPGDELMLSLRVTPQTDMIRKIYVNYFETLEVGNPVRRYRRLVQRFELRFREPPTPGAW